MCNICTRFCADVHQHAVMCVLHVAPAFVVVPPPAYGVQAGGVGVFRCICKRVFVHARECVSFRAPLQVRT